MKTQVRCLSLLVAVSLIATTLCGFSSGLEETKKEAVTLESTTTTKISEKLQAALEDLNDDDLIPICIWINDIDHSMVESQTEQKLGFSKESLIKKSKKIYEPLSANLSPDIIGNVYQEKSDLDLSNNYNFDKKIVKTEILSTMQDFYSANETNIKKLSDDVDSYVNTSRKYAKEAYNKINGEFSYNCLKNAKIIFQSEYAPMIVCEISKSTILYLNTLASVESLSLYEIPECTDESNIAVTVESINGDYTRDTLGFDGNGVKVGQIESGRPQAGTAELVGTKITQGGTSFYTVHASKVASIIAGKSGMAPSAELFCTTSDNFYKNAEWLISSGVSVINMSAGVESDGAYDNMAKWVDHVVYQHSVSWVKSAGNGGEKNEYVTSPGNAYNVITVGAIDDNGTVRITDDTFCPSSNSKTGSGMPSKPDVVAPGAEGTSFAAPHVTGMIAQMMSFCPTLKTFPDAIKAAVIASCDRKTTGESISSITNKEGSGVVNAINAANSISNVLIQKTYYLTSESSISFDFYPLTTGTKTIAIAWLKNTVVSGTHTSPSGFSNTPLADFDLYVYDYSGKCVGCSVSVKNSAEMVRFNAATTNKYTVIIRRSGNGKSYERISLAHVRD